MPRTTLRTKIEDRLAQGRARKETTFLTREFLDLGGSDQVIRVLRQLVKELRLVKLGYGIYCTAFPSRIVPGKAASYAGLEAASRQALDKLNVPWEPSSWTKAYNEGRSTQVPMNAVLKINRRFRRNLSMEGKSLIQERGQPVL
jgi:Family of unknown function (DUF6088)